MKPFHCSVVAALALSLFVLDCAAADPPGDGRAPPCMCWFGVVLDADLCCECSWRTCKAQPVLRPLRRRRTTVQVLAT